MPLSCFPRWRVLCANACGRLSGGQERTSAFFDRRFNIRGRAGHSVDRGGRWCFVSICISTRGWHGRTQVVSIRCIHFVFCRLFVVRKSANARIAGSYVLTLLPCASVLQYRLFSSKNQARASASSLQTRLVWPIPSHVDPFLSPSPQTFLLQTCKLGSMKSKPCCVNATVSRAARQKTLNQFLLLVRNACAESPTMRRT